MLQTCLVLINTLLVSFLVVKAFRQHLGGDCGIWALVAALVVSLLLDVADVLSLLTGVGPLMMGIALKLEGGGAPLWLLATSLHARNGSWRALSRTQWLILACSFFLIIPPSIFRPAAFFYAPDFPAEPVLFLGTVGFYFYLGIMTALVISLVNLEVTLSHASSVEFWQLKFDVLGMGTIIAVQFLYFSQSFLFRSINMTFVPVRELFFCGGLLLLIYARFRQKKPVRIRVSRNIAYKSLVLLAVGAYLLLIGLVGGGMQYVGGPIPQSTIISIFIFCGFMLLTLFLSGRVRRQIKVFLHKNFYANKFDYRTQWLQFTERLSAMMTGADLQQLILTAYCETFGVKCASLYLLDQERGVFRSSAIYEMGVIPEYLACESALVRYLKERLWVFSSRDSNPEVTAEHGEFLSQCEVSFVVPLATHDVLEGFIVLGGLIHPEEGHNYEDFDLMKTIARQASFAILNQRLSTELTRAREAEVIGNIATFVIHDLKNHVAALSLLVENARQYVDDPDFQQDMLKSLDGTVNKMQGLISRLKNLGEKELLHLQPVRLLELAQRTKAIVASADVRISGNAVVVLGDGEELQKVLLNLLINAIEASSVQTPVCVTVGAEPTPFMRVSDQGNGMTADFVRLELFKPFVTTKKEGLGIGLYQCRQIVEAHGGRIEVASEKGKGSTFTVWLPKECADANADEYARTEHG